ncbi:hypothetical protein POL68_11845 [Stigmatella sp. ncwal1]|uniref:Zinc-finger domain-containing protein n=1 Tax=Stigmatella ashevillensis TaxID=2995309 RepID=A0ABT5DA19_9BACT|nr:hypothetical protein [Stigmatella ashevillena]MDC0709157.1 hypothetical protein [Stigmatella ashevillena]
MNTGTCPMRGRVDDHFTRRLKPREEHSLREHLPACVSCKSIYERHLLLRRLDPKAAGGAQERLGRGLGLVRPPMPVAQGAAVLGVVALLVLGVMTTRPDPFANTEGFTARGGAASPSSEALRVYRVRPGMAAEAVGRTIRQGDELAFAYQNPRARKWLLVYGVDEHHHVYWFHPSWPDPETNPLAVKAFEGTALHELPEAISHAFDGKRLVLHGVLSDERLSVKQAEALMKGRDSSEPLPLAGAEHTSFPMQVEP